jgi:aspartate kinase
VVIFTGIAPVPRPLSTGRSGNQKDSPLEYSYPISSPSHGRRSPPHLGYRKVRRGRLLVVKFGGSSLSNPTKIKRASESIVREYSQGNRLVIVASAVGKTTDELLELANGGEGIVEADKDDILAMGERTSARIISASLKSHGIQARYFDPADRDWPIITDDNFQNANPIKTRCIQRIRNYVKPIIDNGMVPVIAGFIGRTIDGRVSTIGRGGSDTTALLLATALGADEVVLVTSVKGILTADPRVVRNAKTLPEINMKALTGIADTGTKFIHRKALRYKDPEINIRVVSNTATSFDSEGTLITGGPLPELEVKLHNPHPTASITLVGRNLSRKPEFMENITKIAAPNLDAVSQDGDSVILYLKQTHGLTKELARLHEIVSMDPDGIALAVRTDRALITVRGVGLEDTPGLVARITNALRSNGINVFGLLTITSSVLVLVDWKKRKEATGLIKISLESN